MIPPYNYKEFTGFIKEFYDDKFCGSSKILETFFIALAENGIKVLDSEQTVWHPMGYAGTSDLICEMDGKLWIGDIKTFESGVEWKAFKTKTYKKWESGECEKKPRAFRTAETEEELMQILEKATKNGTEYTLIEEVDKPLFKKEHYAQTEAYRRAYNVNHFHAAEDLYIKNRFILWLDKRDQSNHYLEIIDEKDNEKHWEMWCTAFKHFKAWK